MLVDNGINFYASALRSVLADFETEVNATVGKIIQPSNIEHGCFAVETTSVTKRTVNPASSVDVASTNIIKKRTSGPEKVETMLKLNLCNKLLTLPHFI